jgi:RecJ-like exonuclease
MQNADFKGGKKSNKFSNKRPNFRNYQEKLDFKNKPILELKEGDAYTGHLKILSKNIPGPVIFVLSDGYGTIEGVVKDSKVDEGDVVEIKGTVNKRASGIQLEILEIKKSDFDFDQALQKYSLPVCKDFQVEHPYYLGLKEEFLRIAGKIRKAILENRPILIRHHNDSDGIISGLNIELACKGLMEEVGLNPNYNIYRSPCKAPYYQSGDVFRDIILTNRLDSHNQKKPLLLVLDNGSTPEDYFGLKTLKLLDYKTIVVDHHNPIEFDLNNGRSSVCEYLEDHINPYLKGFDGTVCAGMLTYELARMIFEKYDYPTFPAVAGISDRSESEITEKYIKLSGQDRSYLSKIGTAIDFISYQLKHDGGKGVYENLFANQNLVEHIFEEVNKGVENQLKSTLPYLRTQEINGLVFSHIDLDKYLMRFTYPTAGKVTSLVHDIVAEGKDNTPVITVGYVADMLIFRASQRVLPLNNIIENLKKVLPNANIDGGGHEQAGAIRFVTAHREQVIEEIKKQIKDLDWLNTETKD